MCGVTQDTPLHIHTPPPPHPLEAAAAAAVMPPSVTIGSEPPKPGGAMGERPPHQEHSPGGGKNIPTIDLSCDENDDLKKAIALSLQDQELDPGDQEVFRLLEESMKESMDAMEESMKSSLLQQGIPMSAEEQEVYRALEASMKDSQTQATVDTTKPRERCRVSGRPVGLKNIGNSCWFNVVIQPLFHIPVFRDLILDFPHTLEQDESMDDTKAPQLVPALRHLFALMIGSNRKYVDPSLAVQVLQGQEMRRNAQQDVCEFIHKLLERLEEEFHLLLRRQGVEKESCGRHISKDADFDNPIMKLFYGQAKKEACEETTTKEQQQQQQQHTPPPPHHHYHHHHHHHHHHTAVADKEDDTPKQEAFGQYPLRVTNFGHIHDSILASMSSGTPHGTGTPPPPRQETWFKMLPPVLIFSLSRYEYSREKKRAEKVHNKFEFPEFLYMDRYMEANKELVKEKHLKVASLKGKLGALNRTLDRYVNYGSGSAKYPIADILNYTLEFAQAGGGSEGQDAPSPLMMEVDGTVEDVEMSEEGLECMPRPSPRTDEGSDCSDVPSQRVSSPSKRMRLVPPTPRFVSDDELSTLQGCLTRWLKDVNTQMDELRRVIGELEKQLSEMYEEPKLKQVPYRLHAAVVHEGQASSGHYWAYIHDPINNGWMKYNDIQVVEASWQEVLQDSVGGHNNTSAYCLLYIDQGRYPTLFPPAPRTEELVSGLALDLQEYIKGDNQAFTRELEEWDARQNRPQKDPPPTKTLPVLTPLCPDIVCLKDGEEGKFIIEIEPMMMDMVREALSVQSDKTHAPGHLIYPLLNHQVTKLQNVNIAHTDTNGLYCEPSLLDFGVYLIRNVRDPDLLLQVYLCDVVLHVSRTLIQSTLVTEQAEREAIQLLQQIKDKQGLVGKEYRAWMRHYHAFVECAWHLVYGLKQQHRIGLEAALPHLVKAYNIHQDLQFKAPAGAKKTLDPRVLRRARNTCLMGLSEETLDAFVKGGTEQMEEVPRVVNTLIVPAVAQLLSSDSEEDRCAVERIRERWCGLLDSNLMGEKKQVVFSDLLQMIFNVSSDSETKTTGRCKTPRPPTALQLYKEYTRYCNEVMSSSYGQKSGQTTTPAAAAKTTAPRNLQTSDL